MQHSSVASSHRRGWVWLGILLLGLGLLGHLLAAWGTGGGPIDYLHHVTGFVILTLAAGVILVPLGMRFWKRRYDITLLALGTVQAVIGFLIYMERFRIA